MITTMAAHSESLSDLLAEDKLIELWPEYPCLYNVRSTEFRDRDQRQQALSEIAGQIQRTSEWVKSRLRQLRNVFTRHNKPASSGSARKNVTKRTAWLLEKLQFLLPYVASRTTQTNLEPRSPSPTGEDPDPDEDFSINDSYGTEASVEAEEEEDDDVVALENSTMPKSTKMPTKKRPKKGTDDEELKLMRSLASSISRSKERATDEWTLFGQFVGESLRKLDNKAQITAQYHINKVLFDAKMGLLNSNSQQQQQTQYNLFQQPQMLSSNQLPFPSGQRSQLLPPTIQSPMFPPPQQPPMFNQLLPQLHSNTPQFPIHGSQQMLSQGGQHMVISNCQDDPRPLDEELNSPLSQPTSTAANEERNTQSYC